MFLVAAAGRHIQSSMALLAIVVIDASALGLTHAQGEHPFVSGPIKRCDGLTAHQCAQAKQTRIARIGGTIQDCERGVLHSCNILLQLRDLSDAARAHVEQVRASIVASGGNNPMTQFLRRNTREAPPGAYRVPQITARSGIPPGISSGTGGAYAGTGGARSGTGGAYAGTGGAYAGTGGAHSGTGGAAPGVPPGVSPGIPNNVHPGVPDNVRIKRSATARVPENVTTGTPARSSTPAKSGMPDGVSTGVPAGVSSGTAAKSGVPENGTVGSTPKSASPVRASAEPTARGDTTAALPTTSAGWHSIAPSGEPDRPTTPAAKSATAPAENGWKSIPPTAAAQSGDTKASKLTAREKELIALRRDAAAAESDYYTAMEELHSDYAWWLGKTEQVGSLAGVMAIGITSGGSLGYVVKELAQDAAIDQSIERGVPFIMEHVPAASAANERLWFGDCTSC